MTTPNSPLHTRRKSSQSSDPHFDSVVLLILAEHGFADQSSYGHTITSTNASIVTNESILSSGKSFQLTVGDIVAAAAGNFSLGFDDYTIEWWVKEAVANDSQYLMTTNTTGQAGGQFLYCSPATDYVYYAGQNRLSWTSNANVNWVHYALVRRGSAHEIYRGGVRVDVRTSTTNHDVYSGGDIVFGRSIVGTYSFTGHMDAMRVTKGVARYDSDGFTPPTEF